MNYLYAHPYILYFHKSSLGLLGTLVFIYFLLIFKLSTFLDLLEWQILGNLLISKKTGGLFLNCKAWRLHTWLCNIVTDPLPNTGHLLPVHHILFIPKMVPMLPHLCKTFTEIQGKCTMCVEYYQNWQNNILFLQQECLGTNELYTLNSNILPTLSGILICFSVDQIFYPVSIQQSRGIMIKSFQGFTGAVRLLSRHSALLIFCRRICIAPFLVPSALCQGAIGPTFLHIHTSFLLCAHQSSLFGSLLYIQLTFTYNKIRKTTTDVLQWSLNCRNWSLPGTEGKKGRSAQQWVRSPSVRPATAPCMSYPDLKH